MATPKNHYRVGRKWGDYTEREKDYMSTPAGFTRSQLGLELYREQEEILQAIGPNGSCVSARTANDVGKTSRIALGAILWHLTSFPRGIVVSTAGSFRQVTNQLIPRLKGQAAKFPDWKFKDDGIKIGEIDRYIGFSTNEAGRFEGFHGENAEEPLMIVVDEAKTVPDGIFEAIERCKPNRLLLLSSPGCAEGEFYRSHTTRSNFYQTFKIAATQCPHITPEWIERMIAKWGEQHPLVRSMIYAEFMESVENAVINLRDVENLMADPPSFVDAVEQKAFCDFSWSSDGDENVLALRRGNRITIETHFREGNPMAAVGKYISEFRRLGLHPHEIEGDAGGGGHVMMSALREQGWPIIEVNNNARARFDPEHYDSIAAEFWYEGAKLIRDKKVILPDDEDMRGQLISRKGEWTPRGKMRVESKQDMKKRGLPSPDRAEAVLGAMGKLLAQKSVSLVQVAQGWQDVENEETNEKLYAGFDAGG